MRTTTYKKLLPAATVSFCLALTGCSSEDEDLLAEPTPVTSSDETTSEETTTEETSEETTTEEETTEETSETESEPEEDIAAASTGTVCGNVTAEWTGNTLSVVALEDDTDCEVALEVMADYLSKNPSGGSPQGSGGFWDSPLGWGCARGYIIPGDSDAGANMNPTCSSDNGPGQVTAIAPERVPEMGL